MPKDLKVFLQLCCALLREPISPTIQQQYLLPSSRSRVFVCEGYLFVKHLKSNEKFSFRCVLEKLDNSITGSLGRQEPKEGCNIPKSPLYRDCVLADPCSATSRTSPSNARRRWQHQKSHSKTWHLESSSQLWHFTLVVGNAIKSRKTKCKLSLYIWWHLCRKVEDIKHVFPSEREKTHLRKAKSRKL